MESIAVSINTAAKSLGLGRTSIYSLVREGKLDTVKIGRRTLIITESMYRLIGSAAIKGAADVR